MLLALSPFSVVYAENASPKSTESDDVYAAFSEALKNQITQLYLSPLNFSGQLSFESSSASVQDSLATEIAMLKNILMDVSCQYSPEEMAQQFALKIYNKDYPKQGFNLKTYNVDDKVLIEMPGVLEQPLMIDLGKIIKQIIQESGIKQNSEEYQKLQKLLSSEAFQEENLTLAIEDFLNAFVKIFEHFEDQGEEEKSFALEGIHENLTLSTKLMNGKNTILAYRSFLSELSKSQAIDKIYQALRPLFAVPYMPHNFESMLEPAIQGTYRLGDQYDEKELAEEIGIEILQYKDADKKPRGYGFKVFEKGMNLVDFNAYYLEDESKTRGMRRPFTAQLDLFETTGEKAVGVNFLVDASQSKEFISVPGSFIISQYNRGNSYNPVEIHFNYSDKDKVKEFSINLNLKENAYSESELLDFLFKMTEEKTGVYSGSFELGNKRIFDEERKKIFSGSFQNCEVIELMPGISALFGKLDLEFETTTYTMQDQSKSSDGSAKDSEEGIQYGPYQMTSVLSFESVHKGNGEFTTSAQITPDQKVKDEYLKLILDGKVSDQLSPEIPKALPQKYAEISSEEEFKKVFEDPKVQENLSMIILFVTGFRVNQ